MKDSNALVMMSPEKFRKQYDIEARTDSEVLSVDREEKTIRVRNGCTEGMSMRSTMTFWSSLRKGESHPRRA
ncbi:MAG: hypothetical protein ACLR0U_13530 [Enterocloster clostridioformis]